MKRQLAYLGMLGTVCALYYYGGRLGLSLAVTHPSATVVWPPTGLALSAVLVLGQRVWPAIFLGAFLVHIATTGNIVTSMSIAGGNTLEAILGAYLTRRFIQTPVVFERANEVVKFTVFTAMISTLVSPTIGVTSLCIAAMARWDHYLNIW